MKTGVSTVADGELAVSSRRLLEASRVEHERAMALALGPLGLQDLEQRFAGATAQMDAYLEARPKTPPMPKGLKEAEDAGIDAEEHLGDSTLRVKEAEANEEASRKRLTLLASEANQRSAHLSVAQETLIALEASLAEARIQAADDSLAVAQVTAAREAQVASQAAKDGQRELNLSNPRETKTLLDNAEQVLQAMRTEQRAAQDERIAITARLGESGEAGLAERRDRAILVRDAATDAIRAYDRRGARPPPPLPHPRPPRGRGRGAA